MTFPIVTDYRKDLAHAPGHGYGRNIGSSAKPVWVVNRRNVLSSVIVHTTNNANKGTSFANECKFIRDSPAVSCHDVISKDGTIAFILPASAEAWHAGTAKAAFTNARAYGIELHCSQGETPTQAQKDSLAWRVRTLIAGYGITKEHIETHRFAATPKGRKSDPEGWPDAEFYQWRDSLFTPDYAGLWGSYFPYFAESGIAAAWRPMATKLGQAVSDETGDARGHVWRLFEHGAVEWTPAGTTIYQRTV